MDLTQPLGALPARQTGWPMGRSVRCCCYRADRPFRVGSPPLDNSSTRVDVQRPTDNPSPNYHCGSIIDERPGPVAVVEETIMRRCQTKY